MNGSMVVGAVGGLAVGALAGVGFVACLPVAGPIGAITLAGGLIAGGSGATVGGAGGSWIGWALGKSEERVDQARTEGRAEAAAEYEAEFERMHEELARRANANTREAA
jgi:hypothetical protein